jgi:hypothetical protein
VVRSSNFPSPQGVRVVVVLVVMDGRRSSNPPPPPIHTSTLSCSPLLDATPGTEGKVTASITSTYNDLLDEAGIAGLFKGLKLKVTLILTLTLTPTPTLTFWMQASVTTLSLVLPGSSGC